MRSRKNNRKTKQTHLYRIDLRQLQSINRLGVHHNILKNLNSLAITRSRNLRYQSFQWSSPSRSSGQKSTTKRTSAQSMITLTLMINELMRPSSPHKDSWSFHLTTIRTREKPLRSLRAPSMRRHGKTSTMMKLRVRRMKRFRNVIRRMRKISIAYQAHPKSSRRWRGSRICSTPMRSSKLRGTCSSLCKHTQHKSNIVYSL